MSKSQAHTIHQRVYQYYATQYTFHSHHSHTTCSLIGLWSHITKRKVADEEFICQEYLDLLIIELNDGKIRNRQLGHQLVCVCCGIPLSRQTQRRVRVLHSGTPEHTYIVSIISPHQITPNTHTCNACWQRAHAQEDTAVKIEPPIQEVDQDPWQNHLANQALKCPKLDVIWKG